MKWDIFVSHASEDKAAVAIPLTEALRRLGLEVWLDHYELEVGDSLSEKIDHGLANARFGVIILSPRFFAKNWPKRELSALVAMENEEKVILPVWHEIDAKAIGSFSPLLAGRMAAQTIDGIEVVAEKLLRAVQAANRKHTDTPSPERSPLESEPTTSSSLDLEIEVRCDAHFFAAFIRNDDIHPVADCRLVLVRLDRYLPKKRDFARNPFEPMTIVHARQIGGGDPSEGSAFATWDTANRSITFQAGIPEFRKSPRPELSAAGVWIAELHLLRGSQTVGRKAIFFQFTPGTKPSLIPDPRAVVVPQADTLRFAHLKDRHVRVTPILPLNCADQEYFVRNVTAEEIELGREGHVVCVPVRKVAGDYPVPDRPNVRVLDLDGRMQWLSVSRSWRFLPDKPGSSEERQYGFFRATTDIDPVIQELQARGQKVRFARTENLSRYFQAGYQLVYDEMGFYLKRGDSILIAHGT